MTKENKPNEDGNVELDNIGNGMDMGATPLDKGDEILDIAEKQYWEDKIDRWKSQVNGIETMVETGIRDKKIVSPAKKVISRLKRHLRRMKLELANHEGFNFHQLGSKLKDLEKLVEYARKKKLPKLIIKSSSKKLNDSPSEANFEQIFGQSEEMLFELRKLESDVQEELKEEFGDFLYFSSGKEPDDSKDLIHGGDFHVGKKTGC